MATTGWQPLSKYRRASPLGKEQGGDNLNDDRAPGVSGVLHLEQLAKSRPSILDPLSGYPEVWMMDHAKRRGTVKMEQVGELTILTPSLRQTPIGK